MPVFREIPVGGGEALWSVPEETPVAFIYNGRNHAVMLATPADLADFAAGFSLTERIVDAVDDILSIDIHFDERGVDIRMDVAAKAVERFDVRQQRRNLVGRTGCGVCGVENAEVFFEPLPKVSQQKTRFEDKALLKAIAALPAHQALNEKTRTVHAAAWAGPGGEIVLAREDVGRHNALDKLLGALAMARAPLDDGFVIVSSRCSCELVEKAARRGVRAILSVSGPTAFAIRKADEANLSLYVRSGDGVAAVN
ncbi:MAG: formate dehydrogenase accessory sulfurtransferase FdhD [Pseudomonadota bacterium]